MQWLLDGTVFSTRDKCGVGWTHNLVIIYQLAHLLVAIAYFSIPISLLSLYTRIKKNEYCVAYNPIIIILFILFILFCGITHACDVIVFWYPAYRLFTVLDIITAIISLITAITLPMVLYEVFRRLPDENKQ